MKHLVILIVMSLVSSILPMNAGAEDGPVCVLEGKSFEDLTRDFTAHWSENEDFCQFKRLTELDLLISKDMRMNPKRYDQRMKFLYSYQDTSPAVNFLMLAFQETWFNLFFNSVLKSEFERAQLQTRWALGGGAGTAMLLLSLPKMGKHSTKLVRFFRAAVRHLLQKRAIVFGGTSLLRQKKLVSGGDEDEHEYRFVEPPLVNARAPTVLDERADGVFLGELHEDFISATAGIFGGMAAGFVPSLIVKKYAPNWAAFFKGSWSRTWLARFASPGMIVGTAVTFVASDMISDHLAVYQFTGRMAETEEELKADARRITEAVRTGREMDIWRLGQRLRNDWALQRYMLSREANQAIEDALDLELQALKPALCVYDAAELLKDERPIFTQRIAKILLEHKIKLQVSVKISGAILSELLRNPHPLTEPLMASMNQNMMSDQARLDTALSAQVIWEGLAEYVESLPGQDCREPRAVP